MINYNLILPFIDIKIYKLLPNVIEYTGKLPRLNHGKRPWGVGENPLKRFPKIVEEAQHEWHILIPNEGLGSRFEWISKGSSLSEERKLSPRDYFTLFYAKKEKSLLEFLNFDFPMRQVLLEKWEQLTQLNHHPFLNDLRKVCNEECANGRVFLGDRKVRLAMQGEGAALNFSGIFKHLAIGKLNHLAIFTKDEQGNSCISHIVEEGSGQTVDSLKDPLYFAFFDKLELDVASLIPKIVSPAHVAVLRKEFADSFQRHA